MNFLNRAIKNTTRRLSKAILLALTFFVIGNFVIIGLGVSDAATEAKNLTRQSMNPVVTYNVDYDAINKYMQELDLDYAAMTDEERAEYEALSRQLYNITTEEISTLTADERVEMVSALQVRQGYGVNVSGVPIGNQREEEDSYSGSGTSCYTDENGEEICETYVYVEPDLLVKTNLFPGMIEFELEQFVLLEGEFYTQEHIDSAAKVALVTDAFADHNNLNVGDTFEITVGQSLSDLENGWYSRFDITEEDLVMELEVIGIFDNKEEVDPASDNFDWMSKYESPENIILLPTMTEAENQLNLQTIIWEADKLNYPDDPYYTDENRPTIENQIYIDEAVLLINDPLSVEGYVDDHSIDLEANYRVLDANNEEFDTLSKPLDTISIFAQFIVVLVVVNAIIIITLVTALTLKTREYEIGVLLAQGVSKGKIIAQFFVELAIVAVIGFTLAVATGSAVAGQVGEAVLKMQISYDGVGEEVEEDPFYYNDPFSADYFTELSIEDLVDQYEVSISPMIIIQIYIAGLGIVLVSILIPSMMIMRFNPKRILTGAQ